MGSIPLKSRAGSSSGREVVGRELTTNRCGIRLDPCGPSYVRACIIDMIYALFHISKYVYVYVSVYIDCLHLILFHIGAPAPSYMMSSRGMWYRGMSVRWNVSELR